MWLTVVAFQRWTEAKTRTEDKTIVLNCDYKKAIEKIKNNNMKFDFVFLDPPYKTDFAEDAAKQIVENNLLNKNGTIVLETDEKEKVLNNLDMNLLEIKDMKKYGRVFLLFLIRKE